MGRRRGGAVGKYALVGGAATGGLFASAAALLWHRLARRPLPQVEGTIEVEGLRGKVRVRRDRWGVPHIEAEVREDLHFAQGYCHAQDRLFQMDFYRRVVEGRVAEMAGEEGLAVDRLMRTLGIRRLAEREAGELEPELRVQLERFCAGVNAAAGQARALPFEMQVLRQRSFEPWRPVDILSLGKLLAFGLSTNWERELLRADMVRELGPELAARLDPVYPADNPVVKQSLEAWSGEGMPLVEQIDRVRRSLGFATEASGSNNWAVSGARSKTGSPLIAGDPHLPQSMPGIWYEVGLRHGSRFVRGASMPGMPGIYMGQNNDVCWTFTNVMADVQDLFVERIEGESYRFGDEWRPLETAREEIVVKGREEPVVLEVRCTHHGPIVNEALGADEGEPLALAWQTLSEATAFAGMFEMLDVASGPDLVAKLEGHTSPASNLIWADRHGSIGYKLVGRLPLRRGGCPDLPKPGWTGEFEWEGTVPYEELPEVVDPESGFLVTANNRIVGDEYPHHITSEWLDGFRARRIEQLIAETEKHDLESFEEIQSDNLSLPGLEAAARLSRLHPRGQRERSAIERLRCWDGCLDPETIAGTIYQAFLLRLA
ncbi:MAG TPA: penicillin acylase family protein, partial [Solirubrobacterales bacterium]|nr:penicillin acylase family protein [Solirubrobacterales bacterium]